MAVYFIQAGEGGPIKIGCTLANPWFRLSCLQVMNAAELRMLGLMDGGGREEREVQRRFARHWLRGEWFEPHPEILAFAAGHYVAPPEAPSRVYRNGNMWLAGAKTEDLLKEQEAA